MILLGMTGPIGHGKSTFAHAIEAIEPSIAHFESSMVIAEVANALHAETDVLPQRDDVKSINTWLHPLPTILQKVVRAKCIFADIQVDAEDVERHPVEYEKLFLHIENMTRNPELLKSNINMDNKEAYRPILQWLGGYLVKKVDPGIWYDEIVRRVEEQEAKGVKICIVGGLRFPNDAAILHKANGKVIKVYRPGHLQYDMMDPTERERDDIKVDCTIVSNGGVEDVNRITPQILEDIKNDQLEKVYYTVPMSSK